MSAATSEAQNLKGAAWLIADMSLNIWALSLVKLMGADYPAVQIVFLRACVGLVVILPWVWVQRRAFLGLPNLPLHALRVGLSALTLCASFFAIARVPFALFSAINFTRPVLLMLMAMVLLNERISRARWWAAAVAFAGALIAVSPGQMQIGWGLASLCLAVVTGTLAIILTRRLKGTPEVVMMAFYTFGIACIMAPLAVPTWTPIAAGDLPLLLLIGLFAQCAQLCFLRAHWAGDAGVLGSVSYLSLVLSTAAGYIAFDEVPGWPLVAGAALILAANVAVTRKL